MNMNEVLATLATERLGTPVHPNDDVNASQSSNDVFPSAIHLAAATQIQEQFIPPSSIWAGPYGRKAGSSKDVVKSGRTHLMDATPVTLGQEFGGYASAVELGVERLQGVLGRVSELPLGGTAVGTGINAPRGFARGVIKRLAEERGLPLAGGPGPFRGPGRPRRPGGGVGRSTHHRGVALEVRHRSALVGEWAPDRAGRDPHP